ncbi:FISUMP domain-containing protein [Prevotella sp. 10(H)]|uniref:FISUMP domain-containing protein n=1 Tax=Prevotella sp. 10(H) TaxID=1158294 RepID=UPI0009DDF080|nr:FISUMP domain-containing protein [Prevotella sp. 10(H)]
MTQLKRFILFVFLFMFLGFGSFLFSQVTVGLDATPAHGAMLQLKENNNVQENSTRGMMLPRVFLTDLSKLKMDALTEYTGVERNKHIGLTVYNVNEDRCQKDPIYKAVYVWDGEHWTILQPMDQDYIVETDQEGQPFKARNFGSRAGIWMIENLAVTTYADGTPIPLHNGTAAVSESYIYPNITSTAWNTPMAVWERSHGLLYTFPVITRGYTPTQPDQAAEPGDTPGSKEIESVLETSAGAKNGKLQGPCPTGWHVPSDREWNTLEEVIYNNMSAYSTYSKDDKPTPPAWDNTWNSVSIYYDRPQTVAAGTHAHGLAMINPCPTPGTTKSTGGKSLLASEGGFDVLLTGLGTAYVNDPIKASSYSSRAYLWSASNRSTSDGIMRRFTPSDSRVYRGPSNKHILLSIRCKKD